MLIYFQTVVRIGPVLSEQFIGSRNKNRFKASEFGIVVYFRAIWISISWAPDLRRSALHKRELWFSFENKKVLGWFLRISRQNFQNWKKISTFSNFKVVFIFHTEPRSRLFLMTQSLFSGTVNDPSNQNVLSHTPLLHASSIRNSWGQVYCFGHNAFWTPHYSCWFINDKCVTLCEEPMVSGKGDIICRGWR